jgi:site-specific recombinase XerD
MAKYRAIQQAFERIKSLDAETAITYFALLHTQASVLDRNNVDPVTKSRRLGHSRVSTTQGIYCHLLE